MLTVLHINNELNICSGITKYILLSAKYSGDEIYHIALALCGDAGNLFAENGVRFLNLKTSVNRPAPLLRFIREVKRICSENGVDIIHCHHRFSDLICRIFKNYFGVKTVTTVHSCVRGFIIVSYLSKNLIAVSPSVHKHLTGYFHRSPDRIKIIYNRLVENEMNGIQASGGFERFAESIRNRKIILYVGRICLEKGTDILLEAFAKLKPEFPDALLLLIGTVEHDGITPEEISSDPDVIHIDALYPAYDYYRIADVAVLPSRSDSMPYAMLEAGYFGVPFVGSATGGISDVVEDCLDGLLFEPGDVSQLKEKIGIMLCDRQAAFRMANTFSRKIRREYCSSDFLPMQREIYNSLN